MTSSILATKLLYHGSNVVVEHPRLLERTRALDFGAGFYLTSDFEQAMRWAKTTVLRREEGVVAVSVFEVDEVAMERLRPSTSTGFVSSPATGPNALTTPMWM